MKILYVIRKREKRHWSKRLQRWITGFTDGQDGFFEASLHYGCSVTRRTYEEAAAMGRSAVARYDDRRNPGRWLGNQSGHCS